MIKKLEKHCSEIYKNHDWVYLCKYNISEIGDKIIDLLQKDN